MVTSFQHYNYVTDGRAAGVRLFGAAVRFLSFPWVGMRYVRIQEDFRVLCLFEQISKLPYLISFLLYLVIINLHWLICSPGMHSKKIALNFIRWIKTVSEDE